VGAVVETVEWGFVPWELVVERELVVEKVVGWFLVRPDTRALVSGIAVRRAVTPALSTASGSCHQERP